MVNVGWRLVLSLLLLLAVGGGSIVLQVFLSRLPGRAPGLILPALTFLLSLVLTLNLAAGVTVRTETMYVVTTEEGEVFQFDDARSAEDCIRDYDGAVLEEQRIGTPRGNWGQLLMTFLLWNLSTAVYLILYFACRRPKRDQRQEELHKMRIDDLE